MMAKPLLRLVLVLYLVALACGMPMAVEEATQRPSPEAVSQLIVSPAPGSTATATPFQPVGPTVTAVPSKTPTLAPTPTKKPSVKKDKIPTPVRVTQKVPEGTFNFLLLGTDLRAGQGFRTDVIMLVSVNTVSGTVSVISFPRDLYVTIPGWTTQRINTAFPSGGFRSLADTFEYNFGVRPSFYVMTNFEGFKGIINSMGGIDVEVGSPISDSCDLPQSRAGICTLSPGTVNMDGAMALWYVRSRHTSNDIDRTRREQEVAYAIFKRIMRRDIFARTPAMYEAWKGSVETNLGLDDVVPLLPVASQLIGDTSRIHRYTIGPGYVYDYITAEGAMVLLPNYGAIQALLAEAIYNQ